MASDNTGKPILFIDIQEGKDKEGNPSYVFNLSNEAQQLLASIGDRNIAVLVIAGPQRTGKSFLANRFLKQMDGFAIGPTTNPCTKGIWIWSKPVRLNDTTDMIILDTEGLNSVQRDQTVDMKIFSLSVLLSSFFIYNNLGHIDETAIENLSLVVRLSENICIQKSTDGDQKLGEYFPLFYWILRDFSLDLKGMSAKEYLEKCLQSVPGNTPEITKKNEIREKFKQYFKYRDCETLVRPLDDESKLARIELQNWNTLRPEFIQGVQNFERKVLTNIRPKTIQNKVLSGKMFLGLAQEYLNAINTGGVPTILNSLESVINGQIRKEFEDARTEYLRRVNLVFSVDKLPIDEEKFNTTHKAIVEDIFNILKVKSKNFLDSQQLVILKKDLQEIMDSEYKIKSTLNTQVSENNSLKIFQNLIQRLTLPIFANSDQIQPNFLVQKFEELQKILQSYNQTAGGNFKYTVFFQKFPGKIFEYFNGVIGRIYKLFQEDLQKMKVKLQQANESSDLIRNQVTLYEKMQKDMQAEIDQHKSIADQLRREQRINSAENGERTQFGKAEEYEMYIDKLNQRIEKLKEENQEFQENLHKVRLELNQKKLEVQQMQVDMDELKGGESQGVTGEFSSELPQALTAIKDLKSQINQMDDFLSSRSTLNTSVSSVESYKQEYDIFRQEKVKLRIDFNLKLEQYKKLVEVEKESLNKKVDVLNSYINELRAKNMEFINQNDEWKKKATVYNELNDEYTRLKEAFAAKSSNLDLSSQRIEQLEAEISKLSESQIMLREQLGLVNFENVEMKSFKDDIFYIMREALKFVQNQKNALPKALKRLNEEDIKEIKKCFSAAGIEMQ